MTAIGAQMPVLQASVALKLPLARHQPASAHSRWGSRLFAPGSIRVRDRKIVIPKKTGRPVQFEITEQARTAIGGWLSDLAGKGGRYLFPSRIREQPNLSTRQYARIVHQWMDHTDLDIMLARRKNGA
jgi:hypothetical protein